MTTLITVPKVFLRNELKLTYALEFVLYPDGLVFDFKRGEGRFFWNFSKKMLFSSATAVFSGCTEIP